ncbi:DUF1120 domain-containing protein [Pantoea sp. Taur]|uniref:DUF1120 domain-containing protein n=1 Tax=Pantoea sp. Taur TaxID=2576757 RepID=UPI001352C0AD|nr:DUF1120 domain-containing protein [Pantoea sp. Taur]MXP57129.1 DUF1120 domain-containing protein [Pantoea sp. Taur]
MKMKTKSLLALTVLATTLGAQAASNIDLKVIGRIDPGTCTPTLTGGGTVDYGTISPSSLSSTGYTILSLKEIDVGINCTAPTKVMLTTINGRPDTSVAPVPEGASGYAAIKVSDIPIFGGTLGDVAVGGLGMAGTAKIGGYSTRIDPATVKLDGVDVDMLSTGNINAVSWAKATVGTLFSNTTARGVSWATKNTLTPLAFTNMSGKLSVQAYLNKKSELPLTQTIKLDGLTTLELVYLP